MIFETKDKKKFNHFYFRALMMPFMGIMLVIGTVVWFLVMCQKKAFIPYTKVYVTCLLTLGVWLIVEGFYLINVAKTINKYLTKDKKDHLS